MSTHRSNIFCVATANVGTHRSIQETISYLENLLESASNNDQGPADVLVLPETCIPGYTQEQITQSNHADIENALKRIQDCCKRQKIGCVLGIPNVQRKDKSYNSAVLIDRYGRILGYQNKMQLVPADVELGNGAMERFATSFIWTLFLSVYLFVTIKGFRNLLDLWC